MYYDTMLQQIQFMYYDITIYIYFSLMDYICYINGQVNLNLTRDEL